MDEDSWMFSGPRSQINLVLRPGTFSCSKMAMTPLCGETIGEVFFIYYFHLQVFFFGNREP